MPPDSTVTGSSKVNVTCSGADSTTSSFAGELPTSVAWAPPLRRAGRRRHKPQRHRHHHRTARRVTEWGKRLHRRIVATGRQVDGPRRPSPPFPSCIPVSSPSDHNHGATRVSAGRHT